MWIPLLLVVIIILFGIYQHLKKRNEIFEKLGLPGPKPEFLFGNIRQIQRTFNGFSVTEWTKQFGKIYGFLQGGWPVIVISDPDMITEIFVKQFSNFHGRKIPNELMTIQRDPEKAKNVNMFFARGNRWKRLRNITNPTFTTLKIKQMIPAIEECVAELINIFNIKINSGKPMIIHTMYQGMTFDVIARTAFGYDSSVQKNSNDELLKNSRQIFGGATNPLVKYLKQLATLFPELIRLFRFILFNTTSLRRPPGIMVKDRIRKVVEERRKIKDSVTGMKDFIQLMLEAETTEDFHPDVHQYNNDTTNTTNVEKKLTADEIVEQSTLFMIAGMETTSTTLSFISYLLASNPEVQDKLIAEIDAMGNTKEVTYDSLQKMTYLHMVIQETLRMFPPASSVVDRRCMSPCTISGYFFPEGMNVMVDVLSLHYSTTYWGDDAKKFNPERFSQENCENRHPMVYLPFGAGPRTCIGMRFALIEMKLALFMILQKYKFTILPEFEEAVKLNPASILSPTNGFAVQLEKRV